MHFSVNYIYNLGSVDCSPKLITEGHYRVISNGFFKIELNFVNSMQWFLKKHNFFWRWKTFLENIMWWILIKYYFGQFYNNLSFMNKHNFVILKLKKKSLLNSSRINYNNRPKITKIFDAFLTNLILFLHNISTYLKKWK